MLTVGGTGFVQGISLMLTVLQIVRLPNIKVRLAISYADVLLMDELGD